MKGTYVALALVAATVALAAALQLYTHPRAPNPPQAPYSPPPSHGQPAPAPTTHTPPPTAPQPPAAVEDKFCGWATGGPCETDTDCVRDGCSGQVCRSVKENPIITTCEWRECYNPDRYNLTCRCIQGRCHWAPQG